MKREFVMALGMGRGSKSPRLAESEFSEGVRPRYRGNLNGFIRALVDIERFPPTQCLYSISAGVESFTGEDVTYRMVG